MNAWDTFWPTFFAELAAAIAGGGVAAALALRLFAAEGRNRRIERDADATLSLRRERSEVVVQLIEAVHRYFTEVTTFGRANFRIPTRDFDLVKRTATKILFDGSDDSFTVYRWVLDTISQDQSGVEQSIRKSSEQIDEEIRAMLVAWVVGEEGVIETMRQKLTLLEAFRSFETTVQDDTEPPG